MDGWGIPVKPDVAANVAAKTPFYDRILKTYPVSELYASEQWVGLPKGQMGNSEVGHMNIGAGRVVFQDLERITHLLNTDKFQEIEAFGSLVDYCIKNDKPVHLLGLVSDGGIHSHIEHLKGLIRLLDANGVKKIYIHVSTDGRDTDPRSAKKYIADLEAFLNTLGTGKIASIIGRYYSMDRNQKWGRIRKAYDLIVHGRGHVFENANAAVKASYDEDVTDEFIKPSVIHEDDKPIATIEEGDAVLFFNFRTDRGRQLTRVLSQENMREFNMVKKDLYFCTLTCYDENFRGIEVLLQKDDIEAGLGETLAKAGKKQIRIAETEKYPHVTFFFNGGREEPFENEERFLIPSPNVATYDLKPEMSAYEVRDTILPKLKAGEPDFVCLNFANPDMVGHTGVFEAAVKACEAVDQCVEAVAECALENDYAVLITADHGNVDRMINKDGTPNTAHSTSKVPLILLNRNSQYKLKDGKLGDIAPTILKLMGLPKPDQMTGEALLEA